MNEMKLEKQFDPLDMNNYRIERLPTLKKSGFERWMSIIGIPLAIFAFVYIYWFAQIPFLDTFDVSLLGKESAKRFADLGAEGFSRINYAMLAIFAASIILWITEPIPNYLTSLVLIIAVVLTGVTTERTAYAQLGHPVMWLNILSFVLASMLVKTQVAKRFALWFVIRFGKNATMIIFSFMIINIVLSAFISATTAKATILLPIFMVIAAIYGATGGDNRNNFGRNLVLQNLFQINIGASGFITGSGANLLAGALIAGAMGWGVFSYQDWFVAAFPLALILMVIGWFVGTKLIFPLKKGEDRPQIEGGLDRLREELAKLGKMKPEEFKAIAIFVAVPCAVGYRQAARYQPDRCRVLGSRGGTAPQGGYSEVERRGYPLAPAALLSGRVHAGCRVGCDQPAGHDDRCPLHPVRYYRGYSLLGTFSYPYRHHALLGVDLPEQDDADAHLRADSDRGSPAF